MSFEPTATGAAAEPGPTPATAGRSATVELTPAMRLQILSTEHWSLLASRSLAWNESFARAGMFLSLLSGAVVALALVAQATAFGEGFALFALVILPVVLFVGIATVIRLGGANRHDAMCVVGMNRIRGAYLEIAPDMAPYFVMSPHDDGRGVGVTMAFDPRGSHLVAELVATPAVIGVVNSVVAASIGALAALRLGAPAIPALLIGIAVFAVAEWLHIAYGRLHRRRGMGDLKPLFPSPPG
jgi:hypothetical protein